MRIWSASPIKPTPADAERWRTVEPAPHPLFHVVPGDVAAWERARPE